VCGLRALRGALRQIGHQGGEREISEEMYLGLLELIAKSGQADILDVEVSELSNPSNVIRKLHGIGQCVIGSKHYFSHTPETEQMQRDLADMQRAGADIGKLAVMPHGALDVLRLLEATARVREEYPHYPLVTMAMCGLGAISRISGEVFGSCMTFASVGKTSAPGQMPLEDVVGILNKISESMDQEMVKSNIFLIGFMGTGKTTVSHSLSELLGYEEIDTDAWITRRQHRSIPEIFESSGEQAFRDMETELLRELGDPQKDLRFIHVAGTNGKGSVLAFISTILSEAGILRRRYGAAAGERQAHARAWSRGASDGRAGDYSGKGAGE